jgi:hypothetical protein
LFLTTQNFVQANDVLIIGARPWDKNVQAFRSRHPGVDYLDVHHQDFSGEGPQLMNIPDGFDMKEDEFHHVDLNNRQQNGAKNFQEFVRGLMKEKKKYDVIIFDYSVEKHILPMDKVKFWAPLPRILTRGGKVYLPMYAINIQTQETFSERRADEYAKRYEKSNFKGEYHSLKKFTERGRESPVAVAFLNRLVLKKEGKRTIHGMFYDDIYVVMFTRK